jgi:hypothetical protein
LFIRFFRLLLTFNRFKFARISHIVDSLLHVQESEIARSRDCSRRAKNRRQSKNAKNIKMTNVEILNKKEQAFQDSTAREFSRFERVEIKMTIKHDEMIDSKIEHAIHRVDSVSDRERDRERRRRREQRERKRRRRDREQAVSK